MADHPDHPVFTPATGQRRHWNELPYQVQRGLQDRLGAAVVEAATQPGGFSPALAARLLLADGRRVFVKAVSGRINPHSPGMHRREARIAAALPASIPTPRFLDLYDDGDWIALIFEDIDERRRGHPGTNRSSIAFWSLLANWSRVGRSGVHAAERGDARRPKTLGDLR